MHIIQSGRSSAANRNVSRTSDFLASRVDQGGFRYIDVSQQVKKYPIDLGNGQIVFSETYRTKEEFLAAGRAEMANAIESGKARRAESTWNQVVKLVAQAEKPVRKPIFDRKSIQEVR